jgi:hypothetical protein
MSWHLRLWRIGSNRTPQVAERFRAACGIAQNRSEPERPSAAQGNDDIPERHQDEKSPMHAIIVSTMMRALRRCSGLPRLQSAAETDAEFAGSKQKYI